MKDKQTNRVTTHQINHTRCFGVSASAGTGMLISTSLAVDRLLN